MMHAGMFDARPRSRELIYILLAQRAARALGDLRMHGENASIESTAAFTSANTPRGWLRLDGNLVRFEQHLYLQQPGYGISYVVGKIEIEKLLADRKRQLGDRFTHAPVRRRARRGGSDPDLAPAVGTDRRAGSGNRADAGRLTRPLDRSSLGSMLRSGTKFKTQQTVRVQNPGFELAILQSLNFFPGSDTEWKCSTQVNLGEPWD